MCLALAAATPLANPLASREKIMKKTIRILIIAALIFNLFAASSDAALARQKQTKDGAGAPPPASPAPKDSAEREGVATAPQEIVREGIKVEFTVEPSASDDGPPELMAEREATVRFRISDTATGTPMSGVRPAAWMSLRETEKTDAAECRNKIQSFMQGSLRARPAVDLNTYYVLTLNEEANISVIDPLLGFGGSKLVTLVLLKSHGADWALTANGERLFVSMPLVNQVAVVDTRTWKVVENIGVGFRPVRVRLQPDGKYLWVGVEGDASEPSGVAAIDARTYKKVAHVPTGAGRHDIAFSDDSRTAFVTNRDAATLSMIDVARLEKARDVKTGPFPSSVAYSPLGRAAYVASEGDDTVVVVGAQSGETIARIPASAGLRSVSFAPGGRFGFIPNTRESLVHIFDASTNRMLHSVKVGKSPDQVAFTDAFAYVRAMDTEEVSAVRLSTLDKEVDVVRFPGGQGAASAAPRFASMPDAISPTPEGNAVLIVNQADKQIYYYSEGMAAPMGSFQNYKRVPRSVRVIDRSLREESAGVYSTSVRLPRSGTYDVALRLDSPRITHCFEAVAASNPASKAEQRRASLGVEYMKHEREVRAGEPYKLRFKLTEAATKQPKHSLEDVRVLFFLAPGVWQQRAWAQHVGAGVYEAAFTPPEGGVYYVFVESRSQGVAFRQLPYHVIQAVTAADAPPPDAAPSANGARN